MLEQLTKVRSYTNRSNAGYVFVLIGCSCITGCAAAHKEVLVVGESRATTLTKLRRVFPKAYKIGCWGQKLHKTEVWRLASDKAAVTLDVDEDGKVTGFGSYVRPDEGVYVGPWSICAATETIKRDYPHRIINSSMSFDKITRVILKNGGYSIYSYYLSNIDGHSVDVYRTREPRFCIFVLRPANAIPPLPMTIDIVARYASKVELDSKGTFTLCWVEKIKMDHVDNRCTVWVKEPENMRRVFIGEPGIGGGPLWEDDWDDDD